MPTSESSTGSFGASIDTGEITDNAVTPAKISVNIPVIKANGSLTIQQATTAQDTDNVDISFALNDLTANDIIRVTLIANDNGTTSTLNYRLSFRDTTTVVYTTQQTGSNCSTYKIVQDSQTNDRVQVYELIEAQANTNSSQEEVLDTNDANIFTTAFTLRITGWFSVGTGGTDGTIRYIVEVLQSTT